MPNETQQTFRVIENIEDTRAEAAQEIEGVQQNQADVQFDRHRQPATEQVLLKWSKIAVGQNSKVQDHLFEGPPEFIEKYDHDRYLVREVGRR